MEGSDLGIEQFGGRCSIGLERSDLYSEQVGGYRKAMELSDVGSEQFGGVL
jgi:hypothetical protein